MADESLFMYEDKSGEFRWTCYAKNGEKVADSGEGYVNMADCRTQAEKLFPTLPWMDGSKPGAHAKKKG